jgi:rod shape-determining protein MreD
MRKFIVIAIFVFICFIIEGVLGEVFGRWFKPNLSIILIVFFNLFRGSEISIMTALLAGLVKDSFSANLFGLNIFSFIICANLVTLFKMYLYQTGSSVSRVMIVALTACCNVLIQYAIMVMFSPIFLKEMLRYVLLPEVLVTAIATPFLFEKLKQCALKLFA